MREQDKADERQVLEEAYKGSRLEAQATEDSRKWFVSEHRDSGGGIHFFKFIIFCGDINKGKKTDLSLHYNGFSKACFRKSFYFWKRKRNKDFLEVRQKLGLLFQDSDSQLFCPTVKEDIAFGPLNLGKKEEMK